MVDANRQYRVPHWGEGYFRVRSNGEFVVQPDAGEQKPGIVLADVIRAAGELSLNLPLLVRFNDILRHRVASLERAFSDALSACEYAADYHPIYPVKVNQQRSVVETIAGCAGAGFECGSKPELMVVLAASAAGGIIVCNGYKDRDYIRLGLIATRMGYRCYLVLEKLSELDLLIDESRRLGVRPLLGLRARLSRISKGHWQNSGGEKSKFGFSATKMIEALERVRGAGLEESLQLLHVHLGSQISSLEDIVQGVEEAASFYAELRAQGFPVATLDLGGGLGVNYDGMGKTDIFSMNYGLREYAQRAAQQSIARVVLDRDVGPGRQVEAFAQTGEQALHVGGLQDGRRAAAKVDVADPMTPGEQAGDPIHLAQQQLEIGRDRRVAPHHLGVAAAEPAQAVAKRNVEVERQRQRRVEAAEPGAVVRGAHLRRKLRRGRVARVARHPAAVFGEQVQGHGLDSGHGSI
ncbi:MAG: biosynthetic arginine decarboxylase [Proteobacteria bacterium]|nr:biosynthetic arginine decarboxylase [Pseudomonadota bacterium]